MAGSLPCRPLSNLSRTVSIRTSCWCHEALAFGLTVSSNSIPLTGTKATCSHLQITVNGSPASIMAPGASTFSVSQGLRGSTYRLDLELTNALTDTTGDGIPDWWKA